MATTTATITLESADLLIDNMSLSANMTLYQHNTTATGLDEMNYQFEWDIPLLDIRGWDWGDITVDFELTHCTCEPPVKSFMGYQFRRK